MIKRRLTNLFHTLRNLPHTLHNNKGRAFHYLASTFLVGALAAISYPAYADTQGIGSNPIVTKIINGFLNFLLQTVTGILYWISFVAAKLFDLLMATTDNLINNPQIKLLWDTSINIANAIFLMVLVVMAVAIVLRKAGGYDFKKAFSLLVIGVVGANVTYLFVKFMNGLSTYFATVIPSIFRDNSDGGLAIFQIGKQIGDSMTEHIKTVGYDNINPWSFVVAILLCAIVSIVIAKVAFVLLERAIQLIVRLLIGPIIFATSLFQGTDKGIKTWFSEVVTWSLVLPIIYFFLEASTIFFSGPNKAGFDPDAFTKIATLDVNGNQDNIGALMDALIFSGIGLYLAWYAGTAHKLMVKAADITNTALGNIDKYTVGAASKALPGAAGITALKTVDAASTGVSLLGLIPGFRNTRLGKGFQNVRNLGSQVAGGINFGKDFIKNAQKESVNKPIEKAATGAARRTTEFFDANGLGGKVLETNLFGIKGANLSGIRKNYQKAAFKRGAVDADTRKEYKEELQRALQTMGDDTEESVDRVTGMAAAADRLTNRQEGYENQQAVLDRMREKISANDYKQFQETAKLFKVNVGGNLLEGDFEDFQRKLDLKQVEIDRKRDQALGQASATAAQKLANISPGIDKAELGDRLARTESKYQELVNKFAPAGPTFQTSIESYITNPDNGQVIEQANHSDVSVLTTLSQNQTAAQTFQNNLQIANSTTATEGQKNSADTALRKTLINAGVSKPEADRFVDKAKKLKQAGIRMVSQPTLDLFGQADQAVQNGHVRDIQTFLDDTKNLRTLNDARVDTSNQLDQRAQQPALRSALQAQATHLQNTGQAAALRNTLQGLTDQFATHAALHPEDPLSAKKLRTLTGPLRAQVDHFVGQLLPAAAVDPQTFTVGKAYEILDAANQMLNQTRPTPTP
jgi:hypothetical protein